MRYRIVVILAAASAAFGAANGQVEGLLNKGGGQNQLKGLGGVLGGQSMASGSMGNVAGLLQYCVTNNYLSGEGVNSVQEKLMGKLPGGTKSNDPGYTDGLKGVLHSGSGTKTDLSGGGIQQEVTRQVCDKVLAQAKSFL